LAHLAIRQLARPLMRELAEYSQGSVSLGIRDRLNIVYIETSRHNSIFNNRMSDVGLTYPIAATAIGRAYLCGCAPAERQAIVDEMHVTTPDAWKQDEDAVLKNIEDYPQRGFCSAHGDFQSDICGVAVALRHPGSGLVIAVKCVVHSFQLKPGELE